MLGVINNQIMDLHEIKIKDIKHLIPNLLLNKLERMEIDNVDQLMEVDQEKFSQINGVGKKAVKHLSDIQQWIKDNERELFELKKSRFQPILNETEVPTLINVAFSKIPDLVPRKLMSKFERHNINTIGDLCQMSKDTFRKLESVGVGTIELLEEFVDKLKNDPYKVSEEYVKNTTGIQVPYEKNVSNSLINNLKLIIDGYIEWLNKNESRYADMIIRYFGLKNTVACTLEDLGLFYEVTRERVRQLIELLLGDLKSFFEGEKSKCANVFCEQSVLNSLQNFVTFLKFKVVLNDKEFEKILEEKYFFKLKRDALPYIELLFKSFGFRISGKVESSFSEFSFYIFDNTIDKNEFFETGRLVFETLKEAVLPIDLFTLTVDLKKKNRKVRSDYIKLVIDKFPEIEVLENENKALFQIRIDLLGTSGDLAERVLYEIGRPTHIDEIISTINRDLFLVGSDRSVTKTSTLNQLKSKKHISFKGKTGIYGFDFGGGNNDSLSELIRKAFLYYDKPLSHLEVIDYIKAIRPNVKDNSIRTIVNMEHLRIEGNKYVLNEWKRKYSDKLLIQVKKPKDREKTRLETVIEIFKKRDCRKIPMRILTKLLRNEYKFPNPTIYATLNNKDYFKKNQNNGATIIELVGGLNPKKRVSTIERIKNEAEVYFSHKKSKVLLRDFVSYVERKLGIGKQNVYKILSNHPDLFSKKIEGKKVYLLYNLTNTGESTFNDIYNWSVVRKLLSQELNEIFSDNRQKKYRYDLDQAIELFQKLISAHTSNEELNGLEEQLIPSIYKFYWASNDRHDLLNHLKQISTSLDPFLQKILYFIDFTKYSELKRKKAGLGKYIEALDKLDPSENRFRKESKSVPVYHFGKHMHRAYNSRNMITHNAKKLNRSQIIDTITSAITIYLFAVMEYFDSLKDKV